MAEAFGSNRTLFSAASQGVVSDGSATPLQRAAEEAIPIKAASLHGAESGHALNGIHLVSSIFLANPFAVS